MKKNIKFYIAPYHYINTFILLILIVFMLVAIQVSAIYDLLFYSNAFFIFIVFAVFMFRIYSMKKNYYIEIEGDIVRLKNHLFKSPIEFNRNDIVSFEEKKRYYRLKGALGEVIINRSFLSYADEEFVVVYFENKS